MDDIAVVEVAALQVLGMKRTGTYTPIPELLVKVYAFTVKRKIAVKQDPRSFFATRLLRKQ